MTSRSANCTPRHHAPAAACCALFLLAWSIGVSAQPAAPGQSPGGGPVQDWRHLPVPRAGTELREREAGVADPARREGEQLRELDELSRQLAPGVPLPAPGLAPSPGPPGAGPAQGR